VSNMWKAVILAAGYGNRMGDLTKSTPKPLLRVLDKTLLEHKLDRLPDSVSEVVIVVGYHGDQIVELLGKNYAGRKISYVWQKELLGTADCLWQAKDLLNEKFLVMMGDDIYSKEDTENCLKYDWSILVKKVGFLRAGGRAIFNDDGTLKNIVEGEHNVADAYVNTGLYVLGPEIFSYPMVQIPGKKEFGLPQTLLQALNDIEIKVVESRGQWLQITSPEDLKLAEEVLKNR